MKSLIIFFSILLGVVDIAFYVKYVMPGTFKNKAKWYKKLSVLKKFFISDYSLFKDTESNQLLSSLNVKLQIPSGPITVTEFCRPVTTPGQYGL